MGFTGVYSFLHKKKIYQGTFISPSAMPDDHYDIDFLGTYFADIRRHLTGNNPEYDPVAIGRSLAFRVQQDYTPAFACIHMDGEYTAQKALAHASHPQERAKKESRIQILFEELENRSEVGKWTSSSVVNEIKKTLPGIFSFTQEFRDGLAEGLRKVFGAVVDCDGEADTQIARVLAAHPTIVINGVEQRRVVVSGDSDLLVYDSVKYLLRRMPRGDAFHFYTRAEVLEALGFQWSCQLAVYGIVSKNDYTVNIPGFSLKKNLDTILSLEVDEETTVDALLDFYINNMQGRVDNPADVTRERFQPSFEIFELMQPTTLDEDEDAPAPNNDAYWNLATEFEGLKTMRLHNKPARDENALPFYIAPGSTRNQFRPIFASKDTILGSSSRELDIRQSEAKDLSDPKPPRKPKKQPRAVADKSKRDKKEEDKKDSTKQKSAKKKKVVWKKGTSVEPGQKLHLKHATRVDRAYRRNQVTMTLLVGSVKANVLRALAAGPGANDNSGSGPGIETGAELGVEAEGSGSGSGSGGLAFGGDAEGEFDDPEGGDDEPGDYGDEPGDDGEIDVSSMSLEDKALAVSNRISRTVTVLNQLRAHLYELLIIDMESILSARFGQVGNTPEASASSSPLSIQDLNDLKISSRTTHSTRPWWLFSLLVNRVHKVDTSND